MEENKEYSCECNKENEMPEKDEKVYWTVKEDKPNVPVKDRAMKNAPLISFIWAGVELFVGLFKLYFYNNGEDYPYNYVNAYVGGDAYNYIINANQATAHFVLAVGLALIGIALLILREVKKEK